MQVPTEILEYIPDLKVPKAFWGASSDSLYLASCTEKQTVFLTDSFQNLLGFPPKHMLEGGLNWWFSLVHPDDLEPMLNEIFQHCFLRPVRQRFKRPFSIEYRARNSSGDYVWIRETKCVVSLTDENKNEFILGRFQDITAAKKEEEFRLRRLVEEDSATNPMLKFALPIIDPKNKRKFVPLSSTQDHAQPEGLVMPSKRELQVLKLIGEGFSSKQIAEKLFISINTVETHRRHLLEKMQVKNSMELIKRSTNAFWLKSAI